MCLCAVEQGLPCGSTSEYKNCSIRNSVTNKNFNLDEIQSIYVTRRFYINEKPILKYFRMKIKDMIYNNGEVSVITIDDITELEEQKEQIKEMANLDYLTKLFNRRYFLEMAEKFYKNAKRDLINMAVVIIDIDYFKKVNDIYGHEGGDFILASFADILKNNLRSSDIICRYGGEEFCILLVLKDKEDTFSIVEKIRKIVENKRFIYENKDISITVSAGINSILGESLNEMIKKSDKMLYEAKNTGRNKTLIFNE